MSREMFHKLEGAASVVAIFILAYSLFVGFGGSFIVWINLPREQAATIYEVVKMIALGAFYSTIIFCGLMVMGRIIFRFIINMIKEIRSCE